ncbi:hypothetical protein AB0J52_27870 [Spirillospora sp. NPDC049652]
MRRIVTTLNAALPIVGLLAAAAPAAAHADPHPAQPATAQVRQEPTYTCNEITHSYVTGADTGRGNCTTSDNLPQHGPINVRFTIRARTGYPTAVSCYVHPFAGAGNANLPGSVSSQTCRDI